MHWLDLRDIECMVDSQGVKKSQPHRHWADNLLNSEGTDKLGSKLPGFHTKVNIL